MVRRIKTISEFHQLRGLPKPEHPLISVIDVETVKHMQAEEPISLTLDFYLIAIKRIYNNSKLIYGQQEYDFDEGLMSFMSPNQVFSLAVDKELRQSGYVLLVHPDFMWNTPLTHAIKQYDYFDYSVHEALFLSHKEEKQINSIIESIRQEYQSNTDRFSQDILIAHLGTLLSYAERFYQRQFLTRKKANHQILSRLENLLTDYFNHEAVISKGLPSPQFISSQLNVSVSYLSRLLKTLTGQSTQQHIHGKLIEKAKEKLSATDLSVSEIAYQLGFEHSQSFSKLFKSKTNQSPLLFRKSFN